MRTYTCICGNKLFFDNSLCTSCGRHVGWCEACEAVVGIESNSDDQAPFHCGLGHYLSACRNNVDYGVCNRYRIDGPGFCRACCLNLTVPDQSIPGNRERWVRLEAAKRRLLYDLRLVGLELTVTDQHNGHPALSFRFMSNEIKENGKWKPLDDGEPVYTGYADGVITINLKETDSVEREKTRVQFGEPQRTLVGHFRHEVGHYFWDVLIRSNDTRYSKFIDTFGDPNDPPYGDALDRYYRDGPMSDWQHSYVSAYASMHPWEDWAETWSTYLHMAGALDTLNAHGWVEYKPPFENVEAAMAAYAQSSIVVNELTRNRGLLPLTPEVLTASVRRKLIFIHKCLPAPNVM